MSFQDQRKERAERMKAAVKKELEPGCSGRYSVFR